MDLLALADFHLVITHGGIGRASRASGRPKATLSRRLQELERGLGVRLLDRGSRTLRLTEEGSILHERTKGLLNEIAEVGTALSDGVDVPRGRLRISAPSLFSHISFGGVAAAFLRAYPEIRLEVVAEDRAVDLVEEGYDLVIRANPTLTDRLVGRCFLRDKMVVVAPRGMARPTSPCGLDAIVTVPAVVLTGPNDADPWLIKSEGSELQLQPDAVLRVSSKLMMRDAVRAGAGAALLPRSIVADDLAAGRLSCWGESSDRRVELWVMHRLSHQASNKVTAFARFLCDAFADPTPPNS